MILAAEGFSELARSWPHWALEGLCELVTFLALTLPIRFWVKRHDRRNHVPPVTLEAVTELLLMQQRMFEQSLDRHIRAHHRSPH